MNQHANLIEGIAWVAGGEALVELCNSLVPVWYPLAQSVEVCQAARGALSLPHGEEWHASLQPARHVGPAEGALLREEE